MKISFITIQTKDIQTSIDFYQNVLGFEISRRFSPRPGMEIVFLDDKHGGKIEFIYNEKEKAYSGQGISIGFYVDDINIIADHLKKNNAVITYGPAAAGNGIKLLYAKDNNGVELGFIQEIKLK
jgi:lactoylglutathione lyase